MIHGSLPLGAVAQAGGGVSFRVWAPSSGRVDVHLVAPAEMTVPLAPEERGYHAAVVDGVGPGVRYFFRLDGSVERPDPCSRFQPLGVHGPSEVIEFGENKTAPPPRTPLADYVIYELHIGTFSPRGDFDGVIERLPDLGELGVTAVELMPVAQFPGERNWGYDGVYPYAVQASYGGPAGLRRLVDACHSAGLAVVLDVVYNHLGPEGNYLRDFGPYFTDTYRTPWGPALNFDGAFSDEVRRFFIESALYYFQTFKIDALRVDAIHAIVDNTARPFLEELAAAVHAFGRREGRPAYVIAESDLNNARVVRPVETGGLGFDAQWADDFHHALHALLTGESNGYYGDFGSVEHLARALRRGYVYAGEYSGFRNRGHGNSAAGLVPENFVVCSQDHDQIGNRMLGERLTSLVSYEGLKLAAGAVLLSGFLPLIFMGEEYGEEAAFQFFVSHSNPGLVEAVRKGRAAEFKAFAWQGEPPDPQSEATLERSRLDWSLAAAGKHARLRELYGTLIRLRRDLPGLRFEGFEQEEVWCDQKAKTLGFRRSSANGDVFAAFNFGREEAALSAPPGGVWRKVFDSAAAEWLGTGSSLPEALDAAAGSPRLGSLAFVLYRRDV
jgi:maltooligosyltrehalose trehalohydrolase